VLECANCGAVIIKEESEVEVAEDSDLANIEEECKFCEEADGFKIIGTLAPYSTEDEIEIVDSDELAEEPEESDEELEEGIFDSKAKKAKHYK
jgi:hypothetical protein